MMQQPVEERVAVLEALRTEDVRQREERRDGVNDRFDKLEGKIDGLHELVDSDIHRRNGGNKWQSVGLKVGTPTVGATSIAAIILWILQRLG